MATLYLLVKLASSGYHGTVEETTDAATQTRIQPQGSIVEGDGVPVGERKGDKIFAKVCYQCHAADSSTAGSPKITHNADWAPRLAQGFDTLFNHALNGFNAMPAKGGQSDLTELELKRAIVYMANQSGGNLPDPDKAPAPTESAASGAASEAAASGAASAAGKSEAAAPAEGGSGDVMAAGKKCLTACALAAMAPIPPSRIRRVSLIKTNGLRVSKKAKIPCLNMLSKVSKIKA